MVDWKRKLTSRKLWLSIAAFVSMLIVFFGYAEEVATQVSSLIMAGGTVVAYVIAEGWSDSANVTKGSSEPIFGIAVEGAEPLKAVEIEAVEIEKTSEG